MRFDEKMVDGAILPLRLVTDPEVVHCQLSEHMRVNWFSGFEKGILGVDVTDMGTIQASEGAFKAHYRQMDIPRDIIDIIWEAAIPVPCPSGMVEELQGAAAVPTIEEWLQTVRCSKRDIAEGSDVRPAAGVTEIGTMRNTYVTR